MKPRLAVRAERGRGKGAASWTLLAHSPEALYVRSKRRRRVLRTWKRAALLLFVLAGLGLATLWYVVAAEFRRQGSLSSTRPASAAFASAPRQLLTREVREESMR